ncbi:glycosyltransferase family 2 protein [Halomonas mongoliensis]|uniref:glycosyltransferase family 2 protein n=1 Tax=Halomonas mongoliensis TaxID=321265 RepID=UPI00403AD458
MPLKVSVVCAWYNRADYIRDTVDSLLAQDCDSFEVIIVNDGSPDPRVREILDSYDDPRLRVIHQENTGFVDAIRRAIETSQASYIAIQGAGDISFKSRIRSQYEHLENNESCVCVAPKVQQTIFGGPSDQAVIPKRYPKNTYNHQDFLKSHPFTHGETMYRRDIYDLVGGYRSAFKYSQDTDLWLRMSRFGSFHILDRVMYERRLFHEDGVSTDNNKQLLQKALSHFAKQCASAKQDDRQKDLIDLYGPVALVLRQPSKGLASFAVKSAVKSMINNKSEEALFFLVFAEKEFPSFYNVFVCSVLRFLFRIKYGRKIIKLAVKLGGKEGKTLATSR